MSDTQAQEAARLAEALNKAAPWADGHVNHDAAALLRSQAARIAELESRVHTCGPTCSKAGCINRRLTAELDALRAELARMREPLSDEQIRALCKESWVFDTAQKWVRAIEAAHGITKTGGEV